MKDEQTVRADWLVKNTERNCSGDRRNKTRAFIADAMKKERELYEANAGLSRRINEQDERIAGLRKALDDRNTMMDNEADKRDKEAKRLQYRANVARESEEMAQDEIMTLTEVVICQAKRITELVEDAK